MIYYISSYYLFYRGTYIGYRNSLNKDREIDFYPNFNNREYTIYHHDCNVIKHIADK